MYAPLAIVHSLDLGVYNLLNKVSGEEFLDNFVARQESNNLLKGGIVLAVYWYFWFRPDFRQQWYRRAIVTIFTGTILAIAATRFLAGLLPFRTRPIYDPLLEHHLTVSVSGFENWSSFPSDTAAYLCALALGLVYLSRRLAVPAFLYSAIWICLPRLYLGIHFLSDVIVGVGIAIASIWIALQLTWVRTVLATRVLAFAEAKPHIFYGLGFVLSYEMTEIFWTTRLLINGAAKLAHAGQHHHHALAMALTIFAMSGAVAAYGLRGFRNK